MRPLIPALVALFIGSSGIPVIFTQLMSAVPKFNSTWAVLNPIHGFVIYSVLLVSILRPPHEKRVFNPAYALPVAALFGVYNVMKSECGKGSEVPGIVVHLTDQLEPLVVMLLSIATGQSARFPCTKWAAAAVLLAASIWYILRDMATAMDLRSPYLLGVCIAKNFPLGGAFMYIQWVLTVRFPVLFPTVLWWWICVFQTFITLVPAYFQFDPTISGGIAFFAFIKQGIECYWFGQPAQECRDMPMLNALGVVFGATMNLAMPVVARHGGAPVLMLMRAATLPFVAFLFTCSAIVGAKAEVLDSQKLMGLVCATSALVLWASGDKEVARSHQGGKQL